MKNRPIGIFDSGVGGLTVAKEVFKKLPNEEIIYLGDTARVPYGTKSPQTIKRFAVENAEFLMRFNVKLIIAACNTVSSTSMNVLKKNFSIPIIGVIESGVKRAIELSKKKRIGIIGTRTTIKSMAYEKAINRISNNIEVFSQNCPLFVPLVEEGWTNGKITLQIAKKYLDTLKEKDIDVLILGCTHYPLLKDVIQKAIGKDVKIVDSASSVAEEVKDMLAVSNELLDTFRKPSHRFFATDAVENFVKTGEKFLEGKIHRVEQASYV